MSRSDNYDFDDDRDLDLKKGLKKNKHRNKRRRKKNVIKDFKDMDLDDMKNIYTYYEEELEGDW